MTAIRSIVPLAFVTSVPRSIAFYEKLGFSTRRTAKADGSDEPTWASLESGGADLMIGKASDPVAASAEAVMFYMYCDDVAAKREELIRAGIAAGAITRPFYAPRGEFRVEDPDGHVIMISHT